MRTTSGVGRVNAYRVRGFRMLIELAVRYQDDKGLCIY